MRRLINILYVFLFLIACQQQPKESNPIRMSLTSSEIVSDSIESMMPGQLIVSGNFILWTDPFHSEKFVHILDATTGKEIATTLQRGEGPTEFLTPTISLMPENKLFVFDYNSNKTAILSIDRAINGESPFLMLENQELKNTTRVINTGENENVYFSPSDNQPFLLIKNKKEISFGKLPVTGDFNNGYDRFQGEVAYSQLHELIIYSCYGIPYMAAYKRKGASFSLHKEFLKNKEYEIKNGGLFYNGEERGAIELTLLKDYIVTIERDRTVDFTDDRRLGRDFTKLPQTIFLYDYDLNLKKIINIGIPVLRLASDSYTNTLYAIGINPDFTLMKYEL